MGAAQDGQRPGDRQAHGDQRRDLSAEIGEQLFLSEATVKTHVGRILAKLDLRDRVQIVVFAYEHGLVTPG